MKSAVVKVKDITCRFLTVAQTRVEALRGVTFDLEYKEFVTFVGHSGAGKSTLLSIIAGLLKASSGQIVLDEVLSKSQIGYVFQKDAVFPWRTVETNLSYHDEIHGVSKQVRRQKAARLCELVGLNPTIYLSKFPKELSGGEARRVSLGMALSLEPALLLMDEPTSSLDWLSRREVQSVIQQVVAGLGTTTISVTHDVEEALWLSDRVVVLSQGKVTANIAVGLPRPRTDDMRTSSEFKSLEDEVVAAMLASSRAEYVVR